jgi:hypothetical protein
VAPEALALILCVEAVYIWRLCVEAVYIWRLSYALRLFTFGVDGLSRVIRFITFNNLVQVRIVRV